MNNRILQTKTELTIAQYFYTVIYRKKKKEKEKIKDVIYLFIYKYKLE